MIIIEDPKVLESLEKQTKELISQNKYWMERANKSESLFRDATNEAGFWRGQYEEQKKRYPSAQPVNIGNCTAGDIWFALIMLFVGGVLGGLVTFVCMRGG